MQKILVTGAAGFIGYHLCKYLLKKNKILYGIDNLNTYYDIKLKKSRLDNLKKRNLEFQKIDLGDKNSLKEIFKKFKPNIVINLAAQAGVRYSIENPHAYVESNISGFLNILEECKNHNVEHLIYASSSSVYGMNKRFPFSENQNVSHPVSLYAASKKSNELFSHSYSHIYKLPCTGLRFFTVYGPWGRPDMALYKFTKNILADKPIDVYGHGKMKRDFTYIDDIVEGIYSLINQIPKENNLFNLENPNPSLSSAPWTVFNIGNNKPTGT